MALLLWEIKLETGEGAAEVVRVCKLFKVDYSEYFKFYTFSSYYPNSVLAFYLLEEERECLWLVGSSLA